jgi:hypothetical protein
VALSALRAPTECRESACSFMPIKMVAVCNVLCFYMHVLECGEVHTVNAMAMMAHWWSVSGELYTMLRTSPDNSRADRRPVGVPVCKGDVRMLELLMAYDSNEDGISYVRLID